MSLGQFPVADVRLDESETAETEQPSVLLAGVTLGEQEDLLEGADGLSPVSEDHVGGAHRPIAADHPAGPRNPLRLDHRQAIRQHLASPAQSDSRPKVLPRRPQRGGSVIRGSVELETFGRDHVAAGSFEVPGQQGDPTGGNHQLRHRLDLVLVPTSDPAQKAAEESA